ncbi:hypothetical protein Esi_0203_0042 [Ectocarpus siliculosus]|uniref:Rab-GAP TBC domain-containing protein n=1 Tax=Ectocarpus siliculosus TaxID=2880 RepID=D7FQL0_ECTSI|nr:hypothetical protein Esi_0203_0042 [Ectocarpus siliculosus]|eukprot:CBJ30605.1 hypothetical protein Esi_0203_0042 [Ectocarpus siliculosus]
MSARCNLSEEGKEDDSDEGDHETWFPGKRVSRTRQYSSCILRQALPTTSPIKLRHCPQTSNCNYGEADEEQGFRDDNNSTHSYTSESTRSGTCNSDEEPESKRENIWGGDTGATIMVERGQHGDDGDIALVAAPVHASSPLLSLPGPPGPRSREQAGKASSSSTVMIRDHTFSVSPQARDSAPLSLSPQPVAVFRSRNSNYTRSSQHKHSSTAIHEPRARCGCRGLTVRIDSGPLGLSLEASYRVGETIVLKQAWSDCAADSGMFAHSMLVSNFPGKVDDDQVRVLDLGLDGRSSSSGLIKVRAVGLERNHATTTVHTRQGSMLNGAPSPPNESRGSVVGVLELDEGDILVRVDNVQVTKKSFTEVASLLDQAERPTRLTFVRHACGRRFVGRDNGYGGGGTCRGAARHKPPCRVAYCGGWDGCCGMMGKSGCGGKQPPNASCVGRVVSSPSPKIETEADGCPVAVILRARRQLRSGGMEQWHELVASRGHLWQRLLRNLSPDSHSDRSGGGGHVCPAHFAGGAKHAVFRVAFATASTLQFVSGISYMAALVLVQEPLEAMAYATLVTLLQERVMQALFPLGDVDLLDAYHLCGGRVVTFRAFGAARSPTPSEPAARGKSGDGQYPFRGQGHRRMAEGDTRSKVVSAGSPREDKATTIRDTGGADRACGWQMGELEEEVVVGEMLPRLVRIFGKALKRRLPALHGHLCKEAIPMSFLCAEWFTTAYARNTPLPLALCALDLFLVRLDDVMIRLGLAILEVLAPSLKMLNGLEILLQYGNLTANVSFQEVLRCALATQSTRVSMGATKISTTLLLPERMTTWSPSRGRRFRGMYA